MPRGSSWSLFPYMTLLYFLNRAPCYESLPSNPHNKNRLIFLKHSFHHSLAKNSLVILFYWKKIISFSFTFNGSSIDPVSLSIYLSLIYHLSSIIYHLYSFSQSWTFGSSLPFGPGVTYCMVHLLHTIKSPLFKDQTGSRLLHEVLLGITLFPAQKFQMKSQFNNKV